MKVNFFYLLSSVLFVTSESLTLGDMKSKISQIIILMMENRSFDHLLGYAKKVDGLRNAPRKVPRDPNDLSQGYVPITPNGYDVSPDDPKHDMNAIAIQINDNQMDGFVQSQIILDQNESNPVAMFTPEAAPIINTLAEEFAVFDRWFCSIPGPTDPNRQYAMAGTSLGITTNFNGTLYPQQSYIDYLRTNGHSSGGYYQDDLWLLGAFDDLNEEVNSENIKDMDQHFFNDLKNGELPEFTWLQPRMNAHFGNGPTWQHPDASVLEGERLIKDIYEAIRASPKWNETLFVITYDEHGGFYDHVPTPKHGVPNPDGIDSDDGSFKFDQLGVRVPTIAISPWIEKGTVVGKGQGPTPTSQFESTSLMATVNELLDVDAPPLGERMAWASRFTNLFTETELLEPRTDCPATLPSLPEAAPDALEIQRKKPLNDHLEAEMLFFCAMNYPDQHNAGVMCDAAYPYTRNQGTASDFIIAEQAKFLDARKRRHEQEKRNMM